MLGLTQSFPALEARCGAAALAVLLLAEPVAASGDFTVSLFGRARVAAVEGVSNQAEESGWYVGVGVVVPLDRIALAAIAQPSESQEEQSTEASKESSSSVEPLPSPSTRRPVSPAKSSGPHLDAVLARETIEAVLRAQGDANSRRRLDSLATRASSSAWLPELRVSGGRSTDQMLRLNPTLDDPTRYTQTGGSGLWAEVRLTWRLDRLVFASEELAVERLRGDRAGVRMRLVSRTFEVLAEWHRARLRARDASALPEERAAADLDRLEAEIWLDVLSDGWFSRRCGADAKRDDDGVPPESRE